MKKSNQNLGAETEIDTKIQFNINNYKTVAITKQLLLWQIAYNMEEGWGKSAHMVWSDIE